MAVHGHGKTESVVIGNPLLQFDPIPIFSVNPPEITVPDNPSVSHVLFVVSHIILLQQYWLHVVYSAALTKEIKPPYDTLYYYLKKTFQLIGEILIGLIVWNWFKKIPLC